MINLERKPRLQRWRCPTSTACKIVPLQDSETCSQGNGATRLANTHGFRRGRRPDAIRICIGNELLESAGPRVETSLVRSIGNLGRRTREFSYTWLPAVVLPQTHQVFEQPFIGNVAFTPNLQAGRNN